ncbi:unnamed protein product [Cuscuta epithymum]|uniref:Uncharacterized protein n=1 Tax=Cuscuta epithymum TaxID=186058 RepID=A0AAV0EVC3_9ASTE|nr:unnamed protein product [Cuscuta epithymum]
MAALRQQPKILVFHKLRQANRALCVLDLDTSSVSAADAAAGFLVLENLYVLLNNFRRIFRRNGHRRGFLAICFQISLPPPSSSGVVGADGVEGDEEQSTCQNGDDDYDEGGEIGAGIVIGRWRRKEVDAPLKTIFGADHF